MENIASMAAKEISKDNSYPENRLAIVIDQENAPNALLYLSARFGVFMFERGQWLNLRNSEKVLDRLAGMSYFHADLFDLDELMNIFSYEDPESLCVHIRDLLEFELVYEFETPFWGFEYLGQGWPDQLRDISEIGDFADGYPNEITVFNPPSQNLRSSGDFSADRERDAWSVAQMNDYAHKIRYLRYEYAGATVKPELDFYQNYPPLNLYLKSVVENCKFMEAEFDRVFFSDDEEIELYNESGLVDLEMYLNGNISLSYPEIMNQCGYLIGQHALRTSIQGKVVTHADRFFEKVTRSSTPFGPGSASFLISKDGFVEALLLETDFGLFHVKSSTANHPNFPLWDFWSLQNSPDSLNGKDFVLISWQNFYEAIEFWLSTNSSEKVKLTKKNVSGFWEKSYFDDENYDDEDDHRRALWLSDSQKISKFPKDAKYLTLWLKDYLNKFEQSLNFEKYKVEIFKFTNVIDDVLEVDPKELAFLVGAHLGHTP